MIRTTINPHAIAHAMKGDVIDTHSAFHDERVRAVREAFPGNQALIYRDTDGTYMAVSLEIEGLWIRGLSPRCFSPFTNFASVPDFDWWGEGA